MWSLVPRGTQILTVAALGVIGTALASVVSELLTGTARPNILYVSGVATVTTLLIIPLSNFVWRPVWRAVPKLNEWLFPDLNGTWTGEAIPAGADGATGEARSVTVWIRQNLFGVTVTLKTDQAESISTRASVEADRGAGRFRIRYSYDAKPLPELDAVNPRHSGAAWLEVQTERGPDNLTGQYFTDRGTKGRLALSRQSPNFEA